MEPSERPSDLVGPGAARLGLREAQKGQRRKVRAFTVFLFGALFLAAFFALTFHTVEVKGPSMLPTLKNGRRVLVSSAYWLVGALRANDIVVIHEADGHGYFIKRIRGMPGDEIEWAYAPRSHPFSAGRFRVPEGTVYVLGDNLDQSTDSRALGPIPAERLLGKVVVAR